MCDDGIHAWLSCLLVCSLIIGIPCMVLGCNETLCPLQEKKETSVIHSEFIYDTCQSSTCASYNSKGQCSLWTYRQYDCSFWQTTLIYENGLCNVRLSGSVPIHTPMTVYVRKTDGSCSANLGTIENLPIVGIVFITLACLCCVLLIFYCIYDASTR